MKKRILAPVITFMTTFCLLSGTVLGADLTAVPTSSNVLVNGKSVAFEAYTIDGSNYFKLRDLSMALNNTDKQFDVAWVQAAGTINLVTGSAYKAAGGELAPGDGKSKSASLSNAGIQINGSPVSLQAYNIGGNNYFKLRDVMDKLNVNVGWDGTKNLITIDTAAAPTAPSGSEASVTISTEITNNTGVDIAELAMSPTNEESWSENLLTSPLKNGEVGQGSMVLTADSLLWDLQAKDYAGNAIEFIGLDFSEVDVNTGAQLVLDTQDGDYYAIIK